MGGSASEPKLDGLHAFAPHGVSTGASPRTTHLRGRHGRDSQSTRGEGGGVSSHCSSRDPAHSLARPHNVGKDAFGPPRKAPPSERPSRERASRAMRCPLVTFLCVPPQRTSTLVSFSFWEQPLTVLLCEG